MDSLEMPAGSVDREKYRRQVQRFVRPLWIKDDVGGYKPSSTASFIKYGGGYFALCAQHAVEGIELHQIGLLENGEGRSKFSSLVSISYDYKIYKDDDIAIFHLKEDALGKYTGESFFDIEEEYVPSTYECLAWIGYPSKRGRHYKEDRIRDDIVIGRKHRLQDDGVPLYNDAKYMIFLGAFLGYAGNILKLFIPNSKINFCKEGDKSNAPSLKGMSGGAVYQFSGGKYYFIGMGIEYDAGGKKCEANGFCKKSGTHYFHGLEKIYKEGVCEAKVVSRGRVLELLGQFKNTKDGEDQEMKFGEEYDLILRGPLRELPEE